MGTPGDRIRLYPVASFVRFAPFPFPQLLVDAQVNRRCRMVAEQHIDTQRSPNLKQNGDVGLPTSPFFASPAPLWYRASDSSLTCHGCLSRELLIVPPRQGTLRFLRLDLRW